MQATVTRVAELLRRGRRGSRRFVLALAAALALAAGAPSAAHYISLDDKLARDGTLTFGVAPVGRPFAYREDGKLKGFDIDWAAEVAHSRGLTLRPVRIARTRLAAALREGEVDMVNSFALGHPAPAGMAVVPYMAVGDHLMVLKANPFRIRAMKDLAGHIVAATAGTTAEAFAREINDRLVAKGHAPMDIHSFPFQRDTHFPVSMGHAAGYFVKTLSALAPSRDPASRVRVFDGIFRPAREVGFAVRKDSADLRDALEHAIAAKVANGTYDALRREHGLPDDLSLFR